MRFLIGCIAIFLWIGVPGCHNPEWTIIRQDDGICRINEKTGEAFIMRRGVWVRVKEEQPPPLNRKRFASAQEYRKIEGRGSFKGSAFSFQLYNGNRDVTVKALPVTMVIVGADGTILDGPRTYLVRGSVKPFEAKTLSFDVLRSPQRGVDAGLDDSFDETYEWTIGEVLVEDANEDDEASCESADSLVY